MRERRIAKVALARKLAVHLYWMWRKGMGLSKDCRVRFACEVDHRPLDRESCSLRREFEVVIMVDVKITGEPGLAMQSFPPQRIVALIESAGRDSPYTAMAPLAGADRTARSAKTGKLPPKIKSRLPRRQKNAQQKAAGHL